MARRKKMDSKRRWKARMRQGKTIPMWVVITFNLVLPRGYLPMPHKAFYHMAF